MAVSFAYHPVEEGLEYHGPSRGVLTLVLVPEPPQPPISALWLGISAALVVFLLVVLSICLVWVLHATRELRALRRRYSNDNVATECALAISVLDLEAVAWLQSVRRPNTIQRAFLQIIRLLQEVVGVGLGVRGGPGVGVGMGT